MINVSELDKNIKKLVQYGINSGLIPESERNYSTNMILDAFGKDDYSDPDISGEEINLDNILDNLLDIACEIHKLCIKKVSVSNRVFNKLHFTGNIQKVI